MTAGWRPAASGLPQAIQVTEPPSEMFMIRIVDVFFRVRFKCPPASLGTEKKCAPVVIGFPSGFLWIDFHSANRVDDPDMGCVSGRHGIISFHKRDTRCCITSYKYTGANTVPKCARRPVIPIILTCCIPTRAGAQQRLQMRWNETAKNIRTCINFNGKTLAPVFLDIRAHGK